MANVNARRIRKRGSFRLDFSTVVPTRRHLKLSHSIVRANEAVRFDKGVSSTCNVPGSVRIAGFPVTLDGNGPLLLTL